MIDNNNLTYDQTVAILKNNDPWGDTRVYAEYKDGVYKGQIDSVKSIVKLDELTSVYRVRLFVKTTSFSDLITNGNIVVAKIDSKE